MENKMNKAMELINSQKEKINKEKEKILIAETRREVNLNNLKEQENKVKDLGYDPNKLSEVIEKMLNEKKTLEKELDDILEELENDI